MAELGAERVLAYTWSDPAGGRGCGVVVLDPERERWILFGNTVAALELQPSAWAPVQGRSWGVDSPDGDFRRSGLDASVREDGTLELRPSGAPAF